MTARLFVPPDPLNPPITPRSLVWVAGNERPFIHVAIAEHSVRMRCGVILSGGRHGAYLRRLTYGEARLIAPPCPACLADLPLGDP